MDIINAQWLWLVPLALIVGLVGGWWWHRWRGPQRDTKGRFTGP
jgi:hypothetical protein